MLQANSDMIYSLMIKNKPWTQRDCLDWHEIQISHHYVHSSRLSVYYLHNVSE